MTYHSLAIYYDNQLAENEQKRVPRDNRFANLHKLHRAKNGEQQWYYPCVILGGGLRAHLPISLSPTFLSLPTAVAPPWPGLP